MIDAWPCESLSAQHGRENTEFRRRFEANGSKEGIMKGFRRAFMVALILPFIAGLMACHTPAGRSAGAVIDDGTITTKVKSKLFADERVSGFAISVDTFKGEVTLTGAVNTPEDKQRADDIARSVDGVKEVNNVLQLKK
jgi:hyperosmotically inducible periplasmic protein